MTSDEVYAFITRRAMVHGPGFRTGGEDLTEAEFASNMLAELSSQIEQAINVVQNAGKIEEIANTPVEAVDMLTAGLGHLVYMAVCACVAAASMPGIERVRVPPSEGLH